MGQAKIRKMNGTYPEQTPQFVKQVMKQLVEGSNKVGRAIFQFYILLLKGHSTEDALDTLIKEGVSTGIISPHSVILELVVWMKHNGEWVKRSAQEKQAFVKKINEFLTLPDGTAIDAELLESFEYNFESETPFSYVSQKTIDISMTVIYNKHWTTQGVIK